MKRLASPLVFVLGCSVPAAPLAAAPRDEPRGRSWFEQVERHRDRGAGRIVDRSTWELQRLGEDRDVRLRRLRPRREFERLDEESDRRHQLDAAARRAGHPEPGVGPDGGSVILSNPPAAAGAIMSPMASQAAADERTLADARDRLFRNVRAVNVAEQRALRSLRRRLNREGRAGEFEVQALSIRERHERLRAGHRADHERLRARVLGRE